MYIGILFQLGARMSQYPFWVGVGAGGRKQSCVRQLTLRCQDSGGDAGGQVARHTESGIQERGPGWRHQLLGGIQSILSPAVSRKLVSLATAIFPFLNYYLLFLKVLSLFLFLFFQSAWSLCWSVTGKRINGENVHFKENRGSFLQTLNRLYKA